MVAHLEDLVPAEPPREQRRLGAGLGVAGQQGGGAPAHGEDERGVVGRGGRVARAGMQCLRGEQARRDPELGRAHDELLHAQRVGVPELAHPDLLEDRDQPAHVVALPVRGHDDVQAPHAGSAQPLHHRPAGAPAVDQPAPPVGVLHQGGVALPHVEEGDGGPRDRDGAQPQGDGEERRAGAGAVRPDEQADEDERARRPHGGVQGRHGEGPEHRQERLDGHVAEGRRQGRHGRGAPGGERRERHHHHAEPGDGHQVRQR